MQSTRLPESWVKSLFAKLSAMYGEKFARQWEGVEQSLLIDTWAEALAPFADDGEHRGKRIAWALQQCRDSHPFPPTLPEFVLLVRQAPRPEPLALPAPKVAPEVAQERAAELSTAAKRIAEKPRDFLAWAMTPPTSGASGSIWEKSIIDLAEAGDPRFERILVDHVRARVIRSDRAAKVFEAIGGDYA